MAFATAEKGGNGQAVDQSRAQDRKRGDMPRPGTPRDWLTAEEREEVTRKSLGTGLWLLGVHFTLYFATMAGAVAPFPIWINILFGVANGALIGLLFLIGHDSGHSAFVPGRVWNKWITRAVFVPCLHSRSLWDVVHNRIHHRYTNLKGFDYVWAPMSKAEFDASPRWRQWVERLYRSALGPLVYYWAAFWIPKLVIPVSPESRDEWRRHLPDTLFVILVGGSVVAGIGVLGSWLSPERPLWLTMLLGWLLPFAVWNYLMALSIFLQHNHPEVPWFDKREDWSFYKGNIRGTAHVDLPFDFLPLFKWVMLHHAHHLLPSIPGYKLTEAQAKLIKAYDKDVVRYRFSLGEYAKIRRSCKLFDFEKKQWTDFNGVPTAAPIDLDRPEGGHDAATPQFKPATAPRRIPARGPSRTAAHAEDSAKDRRAGGE